MDPHAALLRDLAAGFRLLRRQDARLDAVEARVLEPLQLVFGRLVDDQGLAELRLEHWLRRPGVAGNGAQAEAEPGGKSG